MIVPLTHEQTSVRRFPWVTTALIAICTVVFMFTRGGAAEVEAEGMKALTYYRGHQYLELKAPMDRFVEVAPGFKALPPSTPSPARDPEVDSSESWRSISPNSTLPALPPKPSPTTRGKVAPKVPRTTVGEEQIKLDALVNEVQGALDRMPNTRFGLVPSVSSPVTFITYQFLHADFMHLLGNMWFLWIFGFALEDRWGRAMFGGMYFLAGICGGLLHVAISQGSTLPLVGASGAITGAMAAFLVVLPHARFNRFFSPLAWPVNMVLALINSDAKRALFTLVVPFYGWYLRLNRGVSAFVVLPLWLSVDVAHVALQHGGRVAYGCHVGGMAFGLLCAAGLRAFGLQRKLDEAVERTVTTQEDPRLTHAVAAMDAHQYQEAAAALGRLAREKPLSVEVQLELLRCAQRMDDQRLETATYGKIVEIYLRDKQDDLALAMFDEAESKRRLQGVGSAARIRIAERVAARSNDYARAGRLLASVYSARQDNDGLRATLAHARMCVATGDRKMAQDLFQRASSSPAITPELQRAVREDLRQLDG